MNKLFFQTYQSLRRQYQFEFASLPSSLSEQKKLNSVKRCIFFNSKIRPKIAFDLKREDWDLGKLTHNLE